MKMEPNCNKAIIETYPLFIRNNIDQLFTNPNLGLMPVTFEDITPLKALLDDPTCPYHYMLKIPYAGKRLTWELIFDPGNLDFAPDFIFNDDNFLSFADPNVIMEVLPSLANWDIKNDQALSQLLGELLVQYQKMQLGRLAKENMFSNLSKEYQVLISEKILETKDVEVLIDPNMHVHFHLRIFVDISSLPEYYKKNVKGDVMNPGNDATLLRVTYNKTDLSKATAALFLSPRLEFLKKGLQIPTYTRNTSLAEYVLSVYRVLKGTVKQIGENFKLKQEFVTYFCSNQGKKIVEYDFNFIQFLCEVEDGYRCLARIDLSCYPAQKPKVTLASFYCSSLGTNHKCGESIGEYAYSSQWPIEEIVRRLMIQLTSALVKFKTHKH